MPDLMQDRNMNAPNINQPREVIAPAVPSAQMERGREEETAAEVLTGGSLAEALCGIGAIVLAIVALAGILSTYIGAVAAIVVGAGLILEGAAIGTRFSKLLGEMIGPRFSMSDLGGGLTAEFLAGAAGIVLGILALIGMAPAVLLPVAAIVFGAALLLGARATSSLNSVIVEHRYRTRDMVRRAACAMVSGSTGAQVLVGLAAVVLGIVALVGILSMTLSMVAFLVVGGALVVSGLAVSTKMIEMVRR